MSTILFCVFVNNFHVKRNFYLCEIIQVKVKIFFFNESYTISNHQRMTLQKYASVLWIQAKDRPRKALQCREENCIVNNIIRNSNLTAVATHFAILIFSSTVQTRLHFMKWKGRKIGIRSSIYVHRVVVSLKDNNLVYKVISELSCSVHINANKQRCCHISDCQLYWVDLKFTVKKRCTYSNF